MDDKHRHLNNSLFNLTGKKPSVVWATTLHWLVFLSSSLYHMSISSNCSPKSPTLLQIRSGKVICSGLISLSQKVPRFQQVLPLECLFLKIFFSQNISFPKCFNKSLCQIVPLSEKSPEMIFSQNIPFLKVPFLECPF